MYRKRERNIATGFKVVTVVQVFLSLSNLDLLIPGVKSSDSYVPSVFYKSCICLFCNLVLITCIVIILRVMKKYHNYEYVRNKNGILMLTAALFAAMVLNSSQSYMIATCFVLSYQIDHNQPELIQPFYCTIQKAGDPIHIFISFASWMMLSNMLLFYVIVKFKKYTDCLMGISKLDNLVIISVFQHSNFMPKNFDSIIMDTEM